MLQLAGIRLTSSIDPPPLRCELAEFSASKVLVIGAGVVDNNSIHDNTTDNSESSLLSHHTVDDLSLQQ